MIRLNYWSYVTCTACLHQPVYCYWSYHVIIIRKVVRCMISCFDHCACRLMLSLEFSFLILQSSSCWVDVNCINGSRMPWHGNRVESASYMHGYSFNASKCTVLYIIFHMSTLSWSDSIEGLCFPSAFQTYSHFFSLFPCF